MVTAGNSTETAPPPYSISNQEGVVVRENLPPDEVLPPTFIPADEGNAREASEEKRKAESGSVDSSAKPDNHYRVKVSVNLVPIDVFVHDRSGQPKAALRKEDFRVFEDGVEQSVQMFSRGQAPMAVALVIDRSGSVAPLMGRIKTAAYQALQQLKR